ncbi:MAG TPA: 6-carboxytetrahydropterin synthase [Gammaproteobacteria bacterium]|nr:6-carboxytetrahydropterin synthase [Gammaproteobacteria bacterium]
MSRSAILQLHQDALQFSAGHFTILSPTEREDLHGHNYSVSAKFEVLIHHNGMAFDYRLYKQKLNELAAQLDRRFLLPSQSPYLRIEDTGEFWIAHFNNEKIPFLKRDIVILPISNVTIEELSYWFLQQLTLDNSELLQNQIQNITIQVYNGPSQSGASYWEQEQGILQPAKSTLVSCA